MIPNSPFGIDDGERVVNFGAGPTSLPLDILIQIKNEMLNWNNTGMSILEQSHRSPEFKALLHSCKNKLFTLLSLSHDIHSILFMTGGGTLQFSAIPLNLNISNLPADYLITGTWSRKAATEASKFISNLNVIDLFPSNQYDPNWKSKLSPKSSFIYYCDNETIEGREFPSSLIDNDPLFDKHTLVCDASSNFLSKPINSKIGLIFATAQKNFGSAGVTIVVIKRDLLSSSPSSINSSSLINETREIMKNIPTILDYQIFDKHDSIYNTPPVFSIYVVDLYLEWLIKKFNNLNQIHQFSQSKMMKIFHFIHNHIEHFLIPLHQNNLDIEWRSRMNIVFYTKDDNLLINMAKERRIVGIKGHRSIGGIRISLYNSIGEKEMNSCIDLLNHFVQARIEIEKSKSK